MTRVFDWRTRLLAWGAAQIGRPFVWGETDCVALGRAALALCFGRDVVPDIPPWRTVAEAGRTLATHGPLERVFARLGAVAMPLAFARAGDLLLMAEPEEPVGGRTVAVCLDATAVLISSVAAGVQLADTRRLPPATVAYSLWELADE